MKGIPRLFLWMVSVAALMFVGIPSAVAQPIITSFSPTSGPVGTSVTITGTGFTGATSFTFNQVTATFTVNSDTQITATVPAGATTGPITVTTRAGTAVSTTNFTVTQPPTITSFTPTSGGPGTSVVITGTRFTGTTSVTFNQVTATFTVNSDTGITATVPVGATTGPITVTTRAGTAVSTTNFTVPSGVVPCTFAGGTMSLSANAGDTLLIQQDTASGSIDINRGDCSPAAPIAATTTINVAGGAGDQVVDILLYDTVGHTIDWGTINWSIDLGSGTKDRLRIDNTGGDTGVRVTLGASGIDLSTNGSVDVVYAGIEKFEVFGGPGGDVLSAAGSVATGAPFRSAILLKGFNGNDALTGGVGNDILLGGSGNDVLLGGPGRDKLDGGDDDDVLDGGPGRDVADYSRFRSGVFVDLARGEARPLASTVTVSIASASEQSCPVTIFFDKIKRVEDVTGTSACKDRLVGSGRKNRMRGLGGNDTLWGEAGNDSLIGGAGLGDSCIGGPGRDRLAASCETTRS